MNVIDHLREWSASSDEWAELCELQYRIDDQSPVGHIGVEHTARVNAMRRMADLLESYADRMARSPLVRVLGPRDPARLRVEAAEFRAGRNPYAE